MNDFFCGYLIGLLSLIPGISAGTALLLTSQFNKFTYVIGNLFKKNIVKDNILFLIMIFTGVFLGALSCAQIIELLFTYFPVYLTIFFTSIILFSTPLFIKRELKGIKLNKIYLLLGLLVIIITGILFYKQEPFIIKEYPKLTIEFIILFFLSGMLDGALTITPGISGSLILMIIGPYYLYKSYLANLNFNTLIYLIPILTYYLGDLIGLYLGSKISNYYLKKHYLKFMSLIIGMVFGSAIIIIPFKYLANQNIIILISIVLFAFIITNLLKEKN